MQFGNPFPVPSVCPSEEGCKGTNFKQIESYVLTKDYQVSQNHGDFTSPTITNNLLLQEIKIQEQLGKLGLGMIPRTMTVVLIDDLADSCQAGDDIVLTAIRTLLCIFYSVFF